MLPNSVTRAAVAFTLAVGGAGWSCSSDSASGRIAAADASVVNANGMDAATSIDSGIVDSGPNDEPDANGMTRAVKCMTVCDRMDSCASDVCRGAGEPIDTELLRQTCIDECITNRSLSEIPLDGECGPFVRNACRSSERLNEVCRPFPVPDNPLCDEYAQRGAACMAMDRRCLAAKDVGTGLVPTFRNLCAGWAEMGRLVLSEDSAWGMRSCLEAGIQDAIAFLAVDGDESGSGLLADFCRDGATTSADVCSDACSVLSVCIAPDTPSSMGGGLRNVDNCRYRCGVRASPDSSVWSCVARFDVEDELPGSMSPMGGMPGGLTPESRSCGRALSCFQ